MRLTPTNLSVTHLAANDLAQIDTMQFKWYNPFNPKPAPPAFGKGKVLPEGSAPLVLRFPSFTQLTLSTIDSFLSKLVFQWLAPFLEVGFSRPLEKDGTLPRVIFLLCDQSAFLVLQIYGNFPYPVKRGR